MISQAATDPAARKGGERRIIVMMGAPGAGKGTQAERLAEELGLPHISTGELFRQRLSDETPLGKKIRRQVESGGLVSDEIVVAMVEERISERDAEHGAILDGFPRTLAQAEALDRMLKRTGGAHMIVSYVEVSPDLLLERLTGRRICTKDDQHVYHVSAMPPKRPGICDIDGAPLYQREDDSPETVKSRLEKQLPPMYEVIDYYAGKDVLFSVRGDKPPAEVTAELLRLIASRSAV